MQMLPDISDVHHRFVLLWDFGWFLKHIYPNSVICNVIFPSLYRNKTQPKIMPCQHWIRITKKDELSGDCSSNGLSLRENRKGFEANVKQMNRRRCEVKLCFFVSAGVHVAACMSACASKCTVQEFHWGRSHTHRHKHTHTRIHTHGPERLSPAFKPELHCRHVCLIDNK